jgi:hypothetical protein
METLYRTILPAQGTYCVSGIAKTGRIVNRFAESVDAVFDLVNELRGEWNVFVAPNSFDGSSRRADNALFSKSFFIDLDVGDSNKKYQSKEAACEALDKFLDATGLPPPFLVDTGGGLHAYWPQDRDVPIAEWRIYAGRFKDLCTKHGLLIDMAVTADAARIMRAPGTLNYKFDPPRETKVLMVVPAYDYDLFREFFGEVEPGLREILATAERGVDPDVYDHSQFANYEYDFSVIATHSLQGNGCAQIANVLINAKTIEEPLWRAALSVAMRCVDADPAIYRMSEDYDGYSPQETLRKAGETLNATWAYSCKKFADLNPAGCQGCRFAGKIPSPTHLGQRVKALPPVPEAPSEAEAEQEDETLALFFDVFRKNKLQPFSRGVNGGIYYTPPPQVQKDGTTLPAKPVLILKHDLYPVKRMYSKATGGALLVRYRLPKDPQREFPIPSKIFHATDKFRELLGQYEVSFPIEATQLVMKYITKWNDYLIDASTAANVRTQMGWTEEMDGFVIGASEYRKTGEIITTPAAPNVRNIAPLLRASGEYGMWRAAMDELNTPSLEPHAFAVFCGFGSPLMAYTTTPGVTVCYTGRTGFGKSGALYAALSLFGQPRDLSLMDQSATENSLIGRYLVYKNILFGLDEVQGMTATALGNTIHRVSQGKPKLRMQSSVNAEREIEASASLIMFMTTNRDLSEVMKEIRAMPDGEAARFVQITLQKPQAFEDDPLMGRRVFNVFHEHFGHAGPAYIQHLFKVGDDEIRKRISRWGKRFADIFGRDTSFRFYENLIAASFAGAELACEAGIVAFDLDRVFHWIMEQMVKMHETYRIENVDYEEILADFLNDHHSRFLIVRDKQIVTEPRGELIGRCEIHNQIRYVSTIALRRHLSKLGVNTKDFAVNLMKKGIIKATTKKRLGAGWPGGADIGAVAAYELHWQVPDDVLDKS